MIRKTSRGYEVLAESGRCMGIYATRKEADKRLMQVEMFKHMKRKI